MEKTIQHNNMLPGLMTEEVEFFAWTEKDIRCIHKGRILTFEEFPEWVIETVKSDMAGDDHTADSIRRHIYTHFGGLDTTPDIDSAGRLSVSEYTPATSSLPLENGNNITRMQLQVLRRICLSNQTIADQLFISVETVKTHVQNLLIATGLQKKIDLAVYATRKGII